MKAKLFNIVVYAMLLWSVLSAVYLALPLEYQEMIPFDWLTALISGGSTALLGTGGLAVQTFINKAKNASNAKLELVTDKFLELTNEYKELKQAHFELKQEYSELKSEVKENNELLKAELKVKLSNPLIEETARNIINDVLGISIKESGGDSNVKER